MASIHSNGVLVEDSPPFFLLSARPTNTNWRDSIRIGGESPCPQRGFIGPRCGVVRQRAASLDLLHVRLIAGSTLAPTDRSNGSLWEMMLLLCFRGLHHHLHPCKHAPPFFFFKTYSCTLSASALQEFRGSLHKRHISSIPTEFTNVFHSNSSVFLSFYQGSCLQHFYLGLYVLCIVHYYRE